MTGIVAGWQQSGHLYLWRYGVLNRSRRGWHFSAGAVASASIADLLGRMADAKMPARRTLRLSVPSAAIWGLAGLGPPAGERFDKLRLEYRPDADWLSLGEAEDMLTVELGERGAASLRAAFSKLAGGRNDFCIADPHVKHAERWWFW